MASFLKHFRGSRKRGKGSDVQNVSPVVAPIDERAKMPSKLWGDQQQQQQQRPHLNHPNKQNHLSFKWGRRRKRGGSEDIDDSKNGSSKNSKKPESSLLTSTTVPSISPASSSNGNALSPSPSDVSTTPPLTPETIRVTSSTADTTTIATSPQSPTSTSRYAPFVPEEQVPAVQLALAHHHGTSSFTDLEEGGDGDCGGEVFWNAITRAVTALDKAGNDLFAQRDYDGAFLRYERALLLKRSTLHPQKQDQQQQPSSSQSSQQLPPHQPMGMGELEQHQQPRADIVASVATSINNMTYLQQRAGLLSADESIASYFKSLQMKREFLGPNHLSVGKTLNNIGSVFYLKKEYPQALQAYQDARRIMEENLGSQHGDVGTVISNIGDVFFIIEQHEQALEQYRAALEIRWVALGPSDPKVVRLMNRIAALETGNQPVKEEGYMSDSESEEYLEEDRLNDSVFREDLHALQSELNEDMKFFDLLERELAINMIKDKMEILRKLREKSESLDQDEWEDEEEPIAQAIMTRFPPAQEESRTDAPMSESLDQDEGRERIAQALVHAAQEDPLVPAAQGVSRTDEAAPVVAQSVVSNRKLSRSSPDPPKRPTAYMGLTPEERQKALASVQDRLSQLRAERECVSEPSGKDLLTEATCGQTVLKDSGKSSSPIRRSFLFPSKRFQRHQLKRAQMSSATANGDVGHLLTPPASVST